MIPIIITPEDILQDEVQLWEALFESGLQKLHVRKPLASYSELYDMIDRLSVKYHSRVILHQHYKLIDKFNLHGIHLKSISQAEEFKITNTKISRSKSCHTLLEVLNNYKTYDYVFLSPIFNSISKKAYPSAFYLEEIQSFFQDHPQVKNCIALGGIDTNNIKKCLDLGFAGVALLGSIWQADQVSPHLISERFRSMLSNQNSRKMNFPISSFQFISNDFSPLNELEQIRQVCEAGGQWIQVRLKNKSDEAILKLGKQAVKICQKYNATLILNDHVHLVKEIGANGVHLGKSDMSPVKARELLGSDYIIGGTANNMDDVRQLHKSGVDYIGLGPFRFTQTKKNLAPILGIEGYKKIIQACQKEGIDIPIVAIGGIELDDVSSLLINGLHGIALSSSISLAKNIPNTTKEYLKQLKNPLCKN